MSENGKCKCRNGLSLLFSCSGAADTAELADRAARQVHDSGELKMYCLAGVGGGVEEIVNNARDANDLLVVDGCDTDCGAKVMRKAGFTQFLHLRVTDLGFEKGKSPISDEAVNHVAAAILSTKNRGHA